VHPDVVVEPTSTLPAPRVRGVTNWPTPGETCTRAISHLSDLAISTWGGSPLHVDPAAVLLFIDFATGDTLHLSGTARLEWNATGSGDDGGPGRRVSFTVEALTAGPPAALRAGDVVVASARRSVLGDRA
jgi:hypothetical protein